MKKCVLLALAAVLLCSCFKTVNNWVYVRTEIADFAAEEDSLAAVAMGKLLDQAAYKAAGESAYKYVYNRASTMESMVQGADAFYDSVKDTVTFRYTLALKKVLSTSAMKEADKTKETLRTYSFNVE